MLVLKTDRFLIKIWSEHRIVPDQYNVTRERLDRHLVVNSCYCSIFLILYFIQLVILSNLTSFKVCQCFLSHLFFSVSS